MQDGTIEQLWRCATHCAIAPSITADTTAPNRRRSDLQGLRAFAVLVVVAYHFKLPGFPGGFVGVDIFFVLSGFFITRLLMREIETYGRVRLAAFYGARAKRLLPNSIVVLLATLVAAAVLLPTYRFSGIAEDVAFSAGFLANFHFAAHAVDYFHLGDPPSPVLHYWSLAVEEQFYLVLPALMTCIALVFRQRARGLIISSLVCIVLASWAWSIHVTELSSRRRSFIPKIGHGSSRWAVWSACFSKDEARFHALCGCLPPGLAPRHCW